MRECISVHVGQAGSQMGNACWELYCLEHGELCLNLRSKIENCSNAYSFHFQNVIIIDLML